jgi:uncharacterized protein with HEPN domain
VKDGPLRDRYLVDQMLTHADVIAVNVRKGRDEFETDPTTRYAVEHASELFAEAAEKVGKAFKGANPGVPWARLRDLRRMVAHPYDPGADPTHIAQTWRFARDDVPPMVRKLRRSKFPKADDL